MIRTFCDCCNEEITPENQPDQQGIAPIRITDKPAEPAHISATIEYVGKTRGRAFQGDFHVCFFCRLTALNALDKRPSAMPTSHRALNEITDLINTGNADPTKILKIIDAWRAE